MGLEIRDLRPELWPELEALFGKNGACGGCWCMFWRLEQGERYSALQGPALKRRFKARVKRGDVLGAIAFADGEPAGWVTYGPRLSFPRLARARTLACDDADRVWSVPCFFVRRGFRGRGVASALLAHALGRMAERGAPLVEAYPVKPTRDGRPMPDAFAYTGTVAMFDRAGFTLAGSTAHARARMRRRLGARPASTRTR
ncbi:MAG TPA: GNAT family N-acetyltransferase [Myxococcaceae bacterium]|nr:GNAT family N-acetyltransferase [Myxococcaceae bacterium]